MAKICIPPPALNDNLQKSSIMAIGSVTLNISNSDAHLPYDGDGAKIFVTLRTRTTPSSGYIFLLNVTKKENEFVLLFGGITGSGLSINVNGAADIDYIIYK